VLGGKSSEVTLTFLPVKKSLEISARSDVFGENRVLIPARMSDIPPSSKEEEAINVSFNSRYVSDGLKIFKGKEIFLGISDENRPTKIAQQKDGSWFYIVMPTVKT
jgi:DNA polymerase III sliding clamp (beta) subunit (PCNA family)